MKLMKTGWIVLAVALFAVCGCNAGREERSTGKIEWAESYADGLYLAGVTGKPAMLVFGASWCAPCRDLKRHVFTDKRVAMASRELVNIYIDIDQDRGTAGIYKVRAIPAIFFLAPGGELIGPLKGDRSAGNFAQQMKSVSERYRKT
jgi:thiol:disulfide interchange protein